MPDFSMCGNGHGCPLKETCLRYKAKPSSYQSWTDYYKPGIECQFYKQLII